MGLYFNSGQDMYDGEQTNEEEIAEQVFLNTWTVSHLNQVRARASFTHQMQIPRDIIFEGF